MKKLLDCFDYIKRYQVDITESLYILLEFFILKQHNKLSPLLLLASKRKKIYEPFCLELQNLITDYIPPNIHLNLYKILKVIDEVSIQDLGSFLDYITQKKTNNQLYFYSTPYELSVLLIALLDIQKNESVYNPCFGIGSLFLQLPPQTQIYGEELDERFVKIGKLLCKLGEFQHFTLCCNDILKSSSFKTSQGFQQFDKIICNPPLSSHISTQYIKEDERFGGILSKTYPELVFLFHSLVHLKSKGIFILRSLIFKNQALEQKLKYTLEDKIECIIDLPKNIFPFQSHDFCILIMSEKKQNKILHIDASSFFTKSGRYNRLDRVNELVELYHNKPTTPHCRIIKSLTELYPKSKAQNPQLCLGQIAKLIKAQRVYGGNNDTQIYFYEIGVSDFATLGWSKQCQNLRTLGDIAKINKYALKPYDILISLRGSTPKLTIIDPTITQTLIPNSTLFIIRCKTPKEALGLYSYLFSTQAEQNLEQIKDIQGLNKLEIPKNYLQYAKYFEEINALASSLSHLKAQITELKTSIGD